MSVLRINIIMEIGSYIAGNGGYMSNENDAYGKTEIPANFPAEDLVLWKNSGPCSPSSRVYFGVAFYSNSCYAR